MTLRGACLPLRPHTEGLQPAFLPNEPVPLRVPKSDDFLLSGAKYHTRTVEGTHKIGGLFAVLPLFFLVALDIGP